MTIEYINGILLALLVLLTVRQVMAEVRRGSKPAEAPPPNLPEKTTTEVPEKTTTEADAEPVAASAAGSSKVKHLSAITGWEEKDVRDELLDLGIAVIDALEEAGRVRILTNRNRPLYELSTSLKLPSRAPARKEDLGIFGHVNITELEEGKISQRGSVEVAIKRLVAATGASVDVVVEELLQLGEKVADALEAGHLVKVYDDYNDPIYGIGTSLPIGASKAEANPPSSGGGTAVLRVGGQSEGRIGATGQTATETLHEIGATLDKSWPTDKSRVEILVDFDPDQSIKPKFWAFAYGWSAPPEETSGDTDRAEEPVIATMCATPDVPPWMGGGEK